MDENMQNLFNYLNNLGQQIGVNNQLLLDNVRQMIQKAELQNRKRRKKKEGDQLIVSGDLYLSFNRFYDDGSNNLFQISNKLTGKNAVYILDFQGLEENEKFGIFFENEQIWIIGNKNKVKPSYLFDYFVKAAGPFCPGISHTTIGNLLYDYWATAIEQTKNVLTVPVLAGWNNGEFLHNANFMFKKTSDFPSIPVLEKEFPNVPLTEEILQIYFEEFQKIARWRDRVLIVLYPFAGILSSIFYEMHTPIDFGLNFVEIEPLQRTIVCSWLKIFNRESLLPYSLNLTETQLRRLLLSSNDEILIFDATGEDFLTDYQRRKIKKNAKSVIAGMKHQGSITAEQKLHPSYACAFFSKERMLEVGVQNVILDSDFYKDDGKNVLFIEHQVMEAVLSDFVFYVEKNMEKMWNSILKQARKGRSARCSIASVYEILSDYWSEKGIEFSETLKIPGKINWNNILNMAEYEDEELIQEFIFVLRKGIQNFCGIEKRRGGEFKQGAFFYSSDYIWFPTKIVRLILAKQGLMPYLNIILLILKEKNILITDKTGFSKKLQLSGNSIETYQLKRDFFNQPGVNDIVDLAKGESS